MKNETIYDEFGNIIDQPIPEYTTDPITTEAIYDEFGNIVDIDI
jgi:hypothetical protein